MTNKYKTLRKAIIGFNKSKGWKTERDYFKKEGEVAVCFTQKDGFFIITHRSCVNYRQKEEQVVHVLSWCKKTDMFI